MDYKLNVTRLIFHLHNESGAGKISNQIRILYETDKRDKRNIKNRKEKGNEDNGDFN